MRIILITKEKLRQAPRPEGIRLALNWRQWLQRAPFVFAPTT